MTYGYVAILDNKINLLELASRFEAIGCDKVFSGNDFSGTVLPLLEEGDTLILCRLTDLNLSNSNLLTVLRSMFDKNIALICLDDTCIDCRSEHWPIVKEVILTLCATDHTFMVNRTKIGLLSARARGRTGGRPKGIKYKEKAIEAAKLYKENKMSAKEIMETTGIKSKATLYRYLHYTGVFKGRL